MHARSPHSRLLTSNRGKDPAFPRRHSYRKLNFMRRCFYKNTSFFLVADAARLVLLISEFTNQNQYDVSHVSTP
jgi:hypothetical protein